MVKEVVTRFAPSPTGYLHIGGVRTALFNYIFAKKNQGKFLVRIEDTDKERSEEQFIEAIMEGLDWVGLNPDFEPIKQSERFDMYKEEATRLMDLGEAYEDEGAVRLKVKREGSTLVKDLVYGDIEFLNSELDDIVILRSDGSPTYHFCNVIDDNSQGVSHIIRGEDHLPNTPKQIQIVNALGYKEFQYAHLPLVLGEDKKRLSKRHAATDLMAYKNLGYLPEAVKNTLTRLGWSKGDKEIFTISEIINTFDIKDVSRSGAVFDIGKMNFVNQHHLSSLTDEELIKLIKPFNEMNNFDLSNHHDPKKLIRLCVTSGNNLSEISKFIQPFVNDFENYNEDDLNKHLLESGDVIDFFLSELVGIDDWSEESFESVINKALEELKLPMPKIGLPIRVALLGRKNSPHLSSTIYLIAKEIALSRLEKAKKVISEH
ncbi:glutamate--tRNA ligase [SAR86 cluster bacterium]|uniref:Glutamate--tRNA ligase n=1 Tax=SAR86 cluster bacterium TaxID=2030880 RepID=A0A9Q8X1N5_9GAMM|nr:glutamate--tRNA ligase [SAR86 cluster bacterium]